MKNIPRLRFREFEGEWEERRIGDIFEITVGGDIEKLIMSDIYTDKYRYPIYSNSEKNKGLQGYSNIYKQEGDCITVTGRGTLGIAIARYEKFYPIVRLLILRGRKKVDIKFFEERINSLNFYYESTGVPQLTAPQLKGYKVYFPCIFEQQRIASFLTSIDTKIDQLIKKEKLLKKCKKGIMQKIFNQGIRFKDDDGGEFVGWEERRLGDICHIKKGSQLNKDTLIKDGKYPVLNGGINPSGYTNNWNTEAGTIAISEGGNSCGYVNFVKTRFWSSGHNYSLQNLSKIISISYLYQYLKFNELFIMKLRVGSGLPNIQKYLISMVKISFPSLPEQQKIASFLSSLDSKIESIQKQLKLIKEFKKGLLQKMFV